MVKVFVFLLFLILFACKQDLTKKSELSVLNFTELAVFNQDSSVNVLIEIPAGTSEKWELHKGKNILLQDSIDGQPRVIDFLGYPLNYGMIPNTLSDASKGGDGDPLDVLVFGDPVNRGTIMQVKILGAIQFLDRGEQDDKFIAVPSNSSFSSLQDMDELRSEYPAVLQIIATWFENYKGKHIVEVEGYLSKSKAIQEIRESSKIYAKG